MLLIDKYTISQVIDIVNSLSSDMHIESSGQHNKLLPVGLERELLRQVDEESRRLEKMQKVKVRK